MIETFIRGGILSQNDQPTTENPLLDLSGLPRFAEISAGQVEEALDAALATSRAKIAAIETQCPTASWASVASELQDVEEYVERVWAPVSHLNAVRDTDQFRAAVEACLPKLSAFHSEVGQNLSLFEGYRQIADSDDFNALSPEDCQYCLKGFSVVRR